MYLDTLFYSSTYYPIYWKQFACYDYLHGCCTYLYPGCFASLRKGDVQEIEKIKKLDSETSQAEKVAKLRKELAELKKDLLKNENGSLDEIRNIKGCNSRVF